MFRMFVVAGLAAGLLCGVVGAGEPADTKPKEAAKPHKPRQPKEATDAFLKELKDAGSITWVFIHAEPKAGQFWVTKTVADFGGPKVESLSAWQVVKVDGDTAIVEQDADHGVIFAFQVEFKKKAADGPNVKKAWIGKVGEKPEDLKLDFGPEPGLVVPAANAKPLEEPFENLEVAGAKWSGTKSVSVYFNTTTTTWIADKGWFSKCVKMVTAVGTGQGITELQSWGENGEAWLKWDEVKAEPAKEKDQAGKDDPRKEEPKQAEPKKDEQGKENARPAAPPEKEPSKG